ncbi:MAG: hypothetical protein R3C13_01925 [Hyphomonas sp.]|uniref:hypothetical protein n=1 Tax=Hyphomonas sp. TaxID=87 RepID=UPI003529A6B6
MDAKAILRAEIKPVAVRISDAVAVIGAQAIPVFVVIAGLVAQAVSIHVSRHGPVAAASATTAARSAATTAALRQRRESGHGDCASQDCRHSQVSQFQHLHFDLHC